MRDGTKADQMVEAEPDGIARERAAALDLLDRALAILDRVGPFSAAATVSLAMAQAGRDAPPPPMP